ncbi:MAG TPA: transglutaminase family protein [Gammaproteobacteria bacterium]|nr:transglutaminase family protein [Gammaproteobacteria bacterium]
MLIKIGYDIVFDHPVATPILAMLYLHPSCRPAIRRDEYLLLDPDVRISEYVDSFGNRCGRFVAPAGRVRLWNDAVIEHSGEPDHQDAAAEQIEIHELPAEVLEFLLPSRYCEVDRMMPIAWELFAAVPAGRPRVQAVCTYVHGHLRFDYLQARNTRTAYDAYQERVGVCRDFAHLAVALCRCLNIPARYCTGYLPDIGVPESGPMDFSAWFEAYLGNSWYTFDARHNIPRVGRVLMARGRDAADVALLTSFGSSRLERFTVWAEETGEEALLAAP